MTAGPQLRQPAFASQSIEAKRNSCGASLACMTTFDHLGGKTDCRNAMAGMPVLFPGLCDHIEAITTDSSLAHVMHEQQRGHPFRSRQSLLGDMLPGSTTSCMLLSAVCYVLVVPSQAAAG
jgi:hypothetical protein